MPIELSRLVDGLNPENTVLLFGAGSSIPSGAPSARELSSYLAQEFGFDAEGYSLSEIASIIEEQNGRKNLIEALRNRLCRVKPTGGLLNLTLYDWRALYTTNYDNLIEQCYTRAGRNLTVYSSDYDFTVHGSSVATKLFKLHGSIEQDVSDGHVARLIISESDYDKTGNYRTALYDRLKSDMAGAHLIIVGHALGDPDIRDIVNRSMELASAVPGAWKISLLLFVRDENRALLFEKRGMSVCFGGIDELFAELARKLPREPSEGSSGDPLDDAPNLRPVTIDVAHQSKTKANFGRMFNGWPATHADVVAGFTFERTVAEDVSRWLQFEETLCAVVLGASGVGKTTAARQVLQDLRRRSFLCWEHHGDHSLNSSGWSDIAKALKKEGLVGALLVDDAHTHLQALNDLLDQLSSSKLNSLKLICVSTRNHWAPRIKTPIVFKLGKEFLLGRLNQQEIDRLLGLVDSVEEVRVLVEKSFSGFSRYERRRRLVTRCESELFVCLKNIFASEKFDDIILREYADLSEQHQGIYRVVAALESAGVRVHRQLIIRLLGISAEGVQAALVNLADIVNEYSISEKEGLYGWRCRHHVIAAIVTKYKFFEVNELVKLFSDVIDHISPTYDIEMLSMRELCNVESGIPSIPKKEVQNTLLRKMMSIAPGERVPRHRLIRNLIGMGEFEKADTEIRVFENDFRTDGPVARYKVQLLIARATSTPGLMEEDRETILRQAGAFAENAIRRFPNNKSLLAVYCEVGIEICRRYGDYTVYDAAIRELKDAEERIGDPDIPRIIARYESRVRGQPVDADADLTSED